MHPDEITELQPLVETLTTQVGLPTLSVNVDFNDLYSIHGDEAFALIATLRDLLAPRLMPQAHKGYRQRITARLPYDLAAKAALAARQRRWSMSEYVAWCVEEATEHRRSSQPKMVSSTSAVHNSVHNEGEP